MFTSKFSPFSKQRLIVRGTFMLAATLAVGVHPAANAQSINSTFNGTEFQLAEAIRIVCPTLAGTPGSAEANLSIVCTDVVVANGGLNIVQTIDSDVENAVGIIGAGQTNAGGSQANRVGAGLVGGAGAAIGLRINAVQAGLTGRQQYAGFQLFKNGALLTEADSGVEQLSGGAAGDDMSSKLGFWAHGKYNFGSVERTFDEIGFKYDTYGMTVGADYRFSDSLFAGAAFTYAGTDSRFSRSGGGLESDAYIGSIYGSFRVTDNFYINGIASYGETKYDITRNIAYALAGPGAVVSSKLEGNPDGDQYSVGLSTGYDFNMDATVVTPYARINWSEGEIDSYTESEKGTTLGWAQRYGQQRFRSLTTALGANASHAISTPVGVVTAQARGEWVHEYKDDRRRYSTSFVGDPLARNFNVVSGNPDRNYFIAGVGFTGVLAYGISAYINYDALLDYNNVDNHSITLGGRFEF